MPGPFGFHPNKTMRSRALGLARPLVQRGHQVKLFMPPWQTPNEADKSWQEDGVDLRYVPLRGGAIGITRTLIKELLAWQPDVIHAFKPKAYSGLVMWWLWHFYRHKIRLVTDSDDWEGWGGWNDLAPYTPWQKRFFAWQEQWGMRHCHYLTVASRTLESIAWANSVPAQQVLYLPNGAGIGDDVTTAAAPPQLTQLAYRPTLLLYSRLFEFDTRHLVNILQQVKAALPDLAVLLVGAGLYEADAAAFREQLQAAALQDSIIDMGWLEEEQLPVTLAAADAALYLMQDTLLNRTKCPVKLADMIQLGLPVVGEAVGQVTEYVRHGQTGLLCTGGDADGLAAALIHLLQNKSERDRLAAAARRHYQTHFAWPHLAVRLEKVYEW